MATITRTEQSLVDLAEIAEHTAADQPGAAIRFLDQVEADLEDLAEQPGLGAPWVTRRKRLQGVRRWPVHGFNAVGIFYRPTDGGIEVIRVLHGARVTGDRTLDT